MPGKSDGPRIMPLGLDTHAGRRQGGDSTPVPTAFGNLPLPKTLVGKARGLTHNGSPGDIGCIRKSPQRMSSLGLLVTLE